MTQPAVPPMHPLDQKSEKSEGGCRTTRYDDIVFLVDCGGSRHRVFALTDLTGWRNTSGLRRVAGESSASALKTKLLVTKGYYLFGGLMVRLLGSYEPS